MTRSGSAGWKVEYGFPIDRPLLSLKSFPPLEREDSSEKDDLGRGGTTRPVSINDPLTKLV